jgi:hypothetical protein
LTLVPLLDQPCRGNPRESDAWIGQTYLLPGGLARPSGPDRFRYVLRVSASPRGGEIHEHDLLLIENMTRAAAAELAACWCVVKLASAVELRKIGAGRMAGEIWGRCVALVWRELPGPS